MWGIFALLYLHPDCESGYGSRDPIESRYSPDPDMVPDPQHNTAFFLLFSFTNRKYCMRILIVSFCCRAVAPGPSRVEPLLTGGQLHRRGQLVRCQGGKLCGCRGGKLCGCRGGKLCGSRGGKLGRRWGRQPFDPGFHLSPQLSGRGGGGDRSRGQRGGAGASPRKLTSMTPLVFFLSAFFLQDSFACVVSLLFFGGDAWNRTQRADLTTRDVTICAAHLPLTAHLLYLLVTSL